MDYHGVGLLWNQPLSTEARLYLSTKMKAYAFRQSLTAAIEPTLVLSKFCSHSELVVQSSQLSHSPVLGETGTPARWSRIQRSAPLKPVAILRLHLLYTYQNLSAGAFFEHFLYWEAAYLIRRLWDL